MENTQKETKKETIKLISDIHFDFYQRQNQNDKLSDLIFSNKTDYIIVAGDVSNSFYDSVFILTKLSKHYKKVFWVPGNHDMVIPWNHNEKINKELDNISKSYIYIQEIQNNLPENVKLLNGTIEHITEKTTIGGSMGYCDLMYATKMLGVSPEITMQQYLKWYDTYFVGKNIDTAKQLFNSEFDKLSNIVSKSPNIVVSHFLPSYSLVDSKYEKSISSSFFTFDGSELLYNLNTSHIPNSSASSKQKYWMFGHAHSQMKNMVNGINLWCNPIGYPEEHCNIFSHKEFILEID